MAQSKKSSKKRKTKESPQKVEDLIRKRAYEIFLSRKGDHGDDLSDWLQAEKDITSRDTL